MIPSAMISVVVPAARPRGRPGRAIAVRRTIEARNRLVEAHQWLVRAIARRFVEGARELDDLVSEGQFGLLRAAERFDPTRGVPFPTYAAFWIRRYIVYGIKARGDFVTVPHKVSGRERPASRPRRADWSDAEGTKRLVDLQTYDDHRVASVENRDWVEAALSQLPACEAAIVRARFGLDGPPESLFEISGRLGVGPERVRQSSIRAVAKLRAWSLASGESEV